MILRMNSLAPAGDGIHERLPVQQQSEVHLLEEAKRGRAQAFEKLCEGNTAQVFKTALRVTRNPQDAEDAVQDSLMRAFANIKNFKAIARLRPRLRAVVEIGQLQERSMKETARILDISVAAAKGRFSHGRAVLRKSAALRAVVLSRTNPAA